jgi:hypothetical protein
VRFAFFNAAQNFIQQRNIYEVDFEERQQCTSSGEVAAEIKAVPWAPGDGSNNEPLDLGLGLELARR